MLAWPSQSETFLISPVAFKVFMAQEWRRECGVTRLPDSVGTFRAAIATCRSRRWAKPSRVMDRPRALTNRKEVFTAGRMSSRWRTAARVSFAREGVGRQREQVGALLGDGAPGVLRTGALGRAGAAPPIDLGVQIVEVTEAPGREEARADEADERSTRPVSFPLHGRDRTRLKAVVGGELEQRGVEADGVAAALQYDTSHVVVQALPHVASQCAERFDVAAHELASEALR